MNAQDLRKLLEETNDKLSIFASREILSKYDFNVKEFLDLISDFLSDEEMVKMFGFSHIERLESSIKSRIISLISNENIKLQMLNDDNIMRDLSNYQITDIIKKMNDVGKQQILYNQEFMKKHELSNYELQDIVSSLTDEAKLKILTDMDLITNKLHMEDWQIVRINKRIIKRKC